MRTSVEILLNNLRHNLCFFKKNSIKYAPVVKSNAYGHHINSILSLLEEDDNCIFLVFTYLEEIKNVFTKKPVLILSPLYDNYSEIIEEVSKKIVHLTIYDFNSLNHAINIQKLVSKRIYFHLKVDTGMNRFGFSTDQLEHVCKIAKDNGLHIYGIFTHFIDTTRYDTELVSKQKELFNKQTIIIKNYYPDIIRHLESSGALTIDHENGDIVRPGSLIYGLYKSKDHKKRFSEMFSYSLKQILRWKTKLILIKEVKKGSFIGYRSFSIAEKDMRIGICAVGYSDGYCASLSGKASVVVNGQYAKVCALVAMNHITVDLTDIKDVKVGQDVFLVHPDYPLITLESITELSGMSNINFTTQIHSNIVRLAIECDKEKEDLNSSVLSGASFVDIKPILQ